MLDKIKKFFYNFNKHLRQSGYNPPMFYVLLVCAFLVPMIHIIIPVLDAVSFIWCIIGASWLYFQMFIPTRKINKAFVKANTFWAIKNNADNCFYSGTFITRQDAINYHTECLGITWRQCINKGDRAVKVFIKEI